MKLETFFKKFDRFADVPTPANLHFLFHPSYAIADQGQLVPPRAR